MNYLGNNIVGDDKYKKNLRKLKISMNELNKLLTNLNRQFLHAKTLGFVHPKKKTMVFNSNLSQELEIILEKLRKS